MNRQMVAAASVVLVLVVASCGGNIPAPSATGYTDQLASLCRTIDRGITNLDSATSLDAVGTNASHSSTLFEAGINGMKKLSIPTSDKAFAADANDLITSFEDQLDTLDAIAKAAKAGDQAAVDTKIGKLTDQATQGNDLADSMGVSRCQLSPVFDATPTTTTATTTTEPAVTVWPERVWMRAGGPHSILSTWVCVKMRPPMRRMEVVSPARYFRG